MGWVVYAAGVELTRGNEWHLSDISAHREKLVDVNGLPYVVRAGNVSEELTLRVVVVVALLMWTCVL